MQLVAIGRTPADAVSTQRKLKKLKRAGAAESEDEAPERLVDVANLFDDIQRRDRQRARGDDDDDEDAAGGRGRGLELEEDDMADFIEEDSPDEEGGAPRAERAREKARQKAAKRKKATGVALGGLNITAE